MNNNDELKRRIMNYERMLQNPRDYSTEELRRLLDDDFSEIGQSGNIYRREQTISHFNNLKSCDENEREILMTNERFQVISEGVVLLTYRIKKTNLSTKTTTYSFRSSLWKKQNDQWVMVFHQGTPVYV